MVRLRLVGLAEARRLAHDCRRMLFDGVDPLDRKHSQRVAAAVEAAKAITFQQAAEAYIEANKAGWRSPKSLAQWEASLRDYTYPILGALPVQAVDVALVLKVIEPMWSTKAETASRVRGRVEAILDWATAREYRQGENPARWRGHLDKLLPARRKVRHIVHHAALPYCEIGAFVIDLRAQPSVAARTLEFLILTAARSKEVIGARWSEINLNDRLWIVPADRMKSGREHRVPLSDAAMKIVETMAPLKSSEYLFPGQRGGQPIAGTGLFHQLRRMGRTDLTAHGFRSTFRDWCAEMTNSPSEVAEMALAHAVGDKVEAAYRRGDLFDKRRQLAEAWARYCETPRAQGIVVPTTRW